MKTLALDDTERESDAQIKHFGGSFFGTDFLKTRIKNKAKVPKHRRFGTFIMWQGQKDLNPRHVVLETSALPTELYPYVNSLDNKHSIIS